MEIIIVPCVALAASMLTFFSGFGLGTILMPAFLFFFPTDTAIALTAVVHFLNNALKLVILGKKARWDIVLKFGLIAFVAAFFGAKALIMLEQAEPIFSYQWGGAQADITPVKLMLSGLILIFLFLELSPVFQKMSVAPKYLPLGGLLSGFLGGLSGHQGALRGMFLLKCGLNKEAYIATGVVIACLVDIPRIFVYARYFERSGYQEHGVLMAAAVLAAFVGVFLGSRLMAKVTMKAVQAVVSTMLFVIAVLLASGII